MLRQRNRIEGLLFDNKFLISLTLPLMIDLTLSVTVGMADTMMVAQAGEAAVSGVSVINNIQNLLVYILQAFGTGGSVVASQLLGKGEKEKASHSASQLLIISLLFSVSFSAIFLVLRHQTVRVIYGTLEKDVFDSAILYFIPILISMPFLAVQTSSAALARAMGKSSITMYASLIVNAINIVGNYILVHFFSLGALGVGIASLASRIVGALIMFIFLLNKKRVIYLEAPWKWKFDFKMIKLIFKIALPSGIENGMFHLGKILISSTVAGLGTSAIAADAVLNNLAGFANIPASAIGMASVTVIGQCCGAHEFDQVRYYTRKLMLWAYITMGVLGIIMFIICPYLVAIYNLNPNTATLALQVTRVNFVMGVIFWPFTFAFANVLRATGDVKYTMLCSCLSMWIFRVVLSRIFAINLHLGLQGIYFGMYADWLCRIACFTIRYSTGKWRTKAIV